MSDPTLKEPTAEELIIDFNKDNVKAFLKGDKIKNNVVNPEYTGPREKVRNKYELIFSPISRGYYYDNKKTIKYHTSLKTLLKRLYELIAGNPPKNEIAENTLIQTKEENVTSKFISETKEISLKAGDSFFSSEEWYHAGRNKLDNPNPPKGGKRKTRRGRRKSNRKSKKNTKRRTRKH